MRTFRVMSRTHEFESRVHGCLATYRPRLVTEQQWELLRHDVERLAEAAEPPSDADVLALVATLLAFLVDTCRHEELTLAALTSDKVEDFIRRKKAEGLATATLQQLRPRLRRLVRARSHSDIWCRRQDTRARVTPLDPHTDDDMDTMRDVPLGSEQQRAVDVVVELCEKRGLSRADVSAARVAGNQLLVADRVVAVLSPHDRLRQLAGDHGELLDPAALKAARRRIEKHAGISLKLTRLRHRFLLTLATQRQKPIAEVMLCFGVGRDDIDVLIPFLTSVDTRIPHDQFVRDLTGAGS